MPTYEYHCDACEHNFDEFQSFSEKPLKKCPKCKKSKLRRVFGEQPQTGLEDGVARMVGWAREHGARGAREFTGIEVTERLPRSWLGEAAARRD